ncbi:hypothetical protein V1512DRAFT_276900 [Lipomyces arxii]|uniref:uncharacterized protein n=1 Tax=Lipomyces arxii TaxID=56418 RepID=UPI0034CE841E
MSARQYPPSSPPVPTPSPARRALLPSFEPARSSASLHRKSVSASPSKRTPSRKRARSIQSPDGDDEDDDREQAGRGRARSSSSPSFDRKAKTDDPRMPRLQTFYPTPAPTSSVSLPNTSSPVRQQARVAPLEPSVDETVSTTTVRAPLSAVVLVPVPRTGEVVSLGRSSNSSTVVLSRTNKLISRVHVTVKYVAATDSVEITCQGWNGSRVGISNGAEHALAKAESVTIPAEANIVIDVCGERARVVVSDPVVVDDDETDDEVFVAAKDVTPVSDFETSTPSFKVWEDGQDESTVATSDKPVVEDAPVSSVQTKDLLMNTIKLETPANSHDKENPLKPVVQVNKDQDEKHELAPLETDLAKLKTHVIAHLAYSRLASTPLSELKTNLPVTATLPVEILQSIIKSTPCVGVIQRQGKDASGKRLEEQYYYIPEQDDDVHRRAAVEELRGHPGIRNCRKVHKQYFWRKPSLK